MKTVCEKNRCNGCMACIERCYQKCIVIEDNIEAYNAVIDENKCVDCEACRTVCPNTRRVEKRKPIKWYQGWANNDIRKNSSSGGIASAIIQKFINEGGYVASCIYENSNFMFDITNDLNDAKKFAGSKYVKSNTEGIFKKIEQKLIIGKKVLFIGLPCQVAAINNVIKDKKNLYTVDLICHGTPSPMLLNKFLMEEGVDYRGITDIKFRNKSDCGIIINNFKIRPKRVLDEYTCAFLDGISYTENCYSCNYASFDRVSDLTLGDSWGSLLKNEEKNGISLLLIQTEKGKDLINDVNITLNEVDIENAIKNNHQLSRPSSLTPNRKKFLKLIKKGERFKKATFFSLKKRVLKQYIKVLLIKLKIIK